jgi:hypothetical protein
MKGIIIWDVMPFGLLKVNPAFVLISGLTYSSTLKVEAIRSSKTIVGFQWTAVLVTLYNEIYLGFSQNIL